MFNTYLENETPAKTEESEKDEDGSQDEWETVGSDDEESHNSSFELL